MELSTNEKVLVLCARAIKAIDADFDLQEFKVPLLALAIKHGGLSDLIGTIGSWGDSLDDEETKSLMEDFIEATLTDRRPTILERVPCHLGCIQEESPKISPQEQQDC